MDTDELESIRRFWETEHNNGDVMELLAEVDRLAEERGNLAYNFEQLAKVALRDRAARDAALAAIAEHRDQVTSWNIANREPAPADKALWAHLDDRQETP